MNNFKVAIAQIPSIKGNIKCNITTHLESISKAGEKNVSLLIFPELSLTGYEPELANSLAFDIDDFRLSELIEAAKKYDMFLAVGAPLKSENLPYIGIIIISPEGKTTTYAKMNLHPDEALYFSSGNSYSFIEIAGKKIAIAICADTNNPQHAKYCANNGANIYIAGVLITEKGYFADTQNLKKYAEDYGMLVAMANHNFPTGNWSPIGKSAIWDSSGLLEVASEKGRSLIIAEDSPSGWISEIVEI